MLWLLLLLAVMIGVPVGLVALLRPGLLAGVGVVAALMIGLALLILGLAYLSMRTVLSERGSARTMFHRTRKFSHALRETPYSPVA